MVVEGDGFHGLKKNILLLSSSPGRARLKKKKVPAHVTGWKNASSVDLVRYIGHDT